MSLLTVPRHRPIKRVRSREEILSGEYRGATKLILVTFAIVLAAWVVGLAFGPRFQPRYFGRCIELSHTQAMVCGWRIPRKDRY